MKKSRFCAILLSFFTFPLLCGIPCWTASSPNEKSDVLLTTMQEELQRAHTNLGKLDPAPWEEFVFYDHPSGHTRIWEVMRWKAEHLNDPDIKAGPVSPQ